MSWRAALVAAAEHAPAAGQAPYLPSPRPAPNPAAGRRVGRAYFTIVAIVFGFLLVVFVVGGLVVAAAIRR